jgi:uncharacterized OB-fold protein
MVSRLKCPECGLVNFPTATECKRCHARFTGPEPETEKQSSSATAATVLDIPAPALAAAESAGQKPDAADEPALLLAPLPEYFRDEPSRFTVGMILFAVNLCLALILLVYQLHQYYRLYGGEEWKAFTNLTSGVYVSILEPVYYLGWLVKVLAICASVSLIIPFLRKSYAFLRWVHIYLIATFIFILVDGWAIREMETALRKKPQALTIAPFLDQLHLYIYLYGLATILTVIWFLYFRLSNRVEKTFIN